MPVFKDGTLTPKKDFARHSNMEVAMATEITLLLKKNAKVFAVAEFLLPGNPLINLTVICPQKQDLAELLWNDTFSTKNPENVKSLSLGDAVAMPITSPALKPAKSNV